MTRAARRRFCSAGGKTRWGAALLVSAVLAVPALHPIPSAAAEMDCASESLNRQDIAKVEAVARPTLARSVHLEVTYACWNPDHSRAEVSTPKVPTPEGAQQWWAVSCQRDESTWTCDRPELKQFIAVDLAVKELRTRHTRRAGPFACLPRAFDLCRHYFTDSGLRQYREWRSRAGGTTPP